MRRVVTDLDIIGTGLKNDCLQFFTTVGRRGNLLTSQTACARFFIHTCLQFCRRQRQKRHTPLVQQPVQHQAQGVNISRTAIGLVIIHFRRHVLICTDLSTTHGLFHGFGNAKIAQLIISIIRNKNVLRFDIPVDNLMLFAQFKSCAQILRNFYDRLFRDLCRQCFR